MSKVGSTRHKHLKTLGLILIVAAAFILSLYESLQPVYVVSAVILLVLTALFLVLFDMVYAKYIESKELSKDIQAVVNIYAAVYRINIKTNHARLLRNIKKFDPLMEGGMTDYRGPLQELVRMFASEQSRDTLLNFLDKGSYEERLKEGHSLSHEFLDRHGRWIRVQLIEVDRDESGKLVHVIWAFESIDEDRKQRENLKLMAETDAMTGIRNRNSGEARIKEEMKSGSKGMFILVDADHFKAINDNFGHDVGDKVIIAIAGCMKRTFRDTDVVFRLGGDEFAAFAPSVEKEEIGRRIINRLYDNINMIDIPEMNGRKISISVGATFYPISKFDNFDLLYQRADKGMYESKKKEGNALSFNMQN
ncbi:diguanylate cyclase (GGDEF) domain-containing protein [Lachnospiraceae bacterium JC7]|nr:diguanylate cyclase (GGDEF) domain-containing protein [Lachnospiraceae bacterium JC7]